LFYKIEILNNQGKNMDIYQLPSTLPTAWWLLVKKEF